jgi:hypothetical protein
MRHKFLYNEEEIIFTQKGVCAVGTHSIIKALRTHGYDLKSNYDTR